MAADIPTGIRNNDAILGRLSDHMFIASSHNSTKLNLHRLFILRNIGIAGQGLVILVTIKWLLIPLPILPLILILTSLAAWNLFTWWQLHQPGEVSDRELFVQLALDVLALTGVLYFCGGATNPFTWIFLLPVIIAATVLPKRFAWGMAGLSVFCYSLLVWLYVPLHAPDMSHMSHGDNFTLHVFGMWFGFVLSAGMVAYFVSGMANTLRERDQILARAREQALRDERLVALGTLAAGAAHELGTPLGTMAIVTSELERAYTADKDADLREQLGIIKEQIARCKQALAVISASAGEVRADSGQPVPVKKYLEQLTGQWCRQRPNINLRYRLEGNPTASHILAEHVLHQALTNILDNAADASPEFVELHAKWNDDELTIEINDRGAGLSAETTAFVGKTLYSTKQQGLGLGLFLAHAAIERMGGNVMLFNRQGGGVCTRIILPLFVLAPNDSTETATA